MSLRLAVILAVAAVLVEGGYYKIRPPHPPPPPPPSLYYGPHPPHHHHYPPRIYPPYPPHRSPHHRLYHQRPHKPYPPFKAGYAPSFRAPIVKETFSPPQSLYTPTFIKEEDRGPIHTIPAPNLGPSDRPSLFHPDVYKQDIYKEDVFANDGYKKPPHGSGEDLVALLKHGITKVNVPHSSGYQVTEDPAAASPYNYGGTYFAPDPDPAVPALKIPPTTDPHSHPTNGQVPLDLYVQQQAEKTGQYAHQQQTTAEQSNTLTPQELFNLLNYQQPTGVQQHVQYVLPQPTTQLFSDLGENNAHQQHSLQQLAQQQLDQVNKQVHANEHLGQFAQPQYQSFNYEEQGQQQGLYGDLRLDLQTKGFNDGGHYKDPLEDNYVAGSEREESYVRDAANEIVQTKKHVSESVGKDRSNPGDMKSQYSKKLVGTEGNVYHPNLIEVGKSSEEKIKAHDQKQEQINQRENQAIDSAGQFQTTSAKPENNVQLQKSIQIYENTYAQNEDLIKEEIKNVDDYPKEGNIVKGKVISTDDKEFSEDENVHFVDAIPFGSRVRPKRF